jgi:hypothetical protein
MKLTDIPSLHIDDRKAFEMKSGPLSGSAQSAALNRCGVETGGPSTSAGVADVVPTNSPVDRAAWHGKVKARVNVEIKP